MADDGKNKQITAFFFRSKCSNTVQQEYRSAQSTADEIFARSHDQHILDESDRPYE